MKNSKIIFFIGIFVFLNLTLLGAATFPAGIRHLYYLMFTPDDLYDPIVSSDFSFDIKRFSKTFELHPKYSALYDLSISFLDEGITSKHKFSGKLLVEFLHDGNIVSQKTADKIIAAGYKGKDISRYNRITLMTFEIPIIGKFKDGVSLRITVLEVDQILKKYKDSIKLQIAVSPTP